MEDGERREEGRPSGFGRRDRQSDRTDQRDRERTGRRGRTGRTGRLAASSPEKQLQKGKERSSLIIHQSALGIKLSGYRVIRCSVQLIPLPLPIHSLHPDLTTPALLHSRGATSLRGSRDSTTLVSAKIYYVTKN